MSDIEWTGDAMAYAKTHVRAGVLYVDVMGRIWRNKIWGRSAGWRAIHPRRVENVGGKGYLRVSLARPGGLAIVMAHCLVYEVRVAPIPDGLEINHKNLIKTDNRPDNLELMTGAQNTQHAYDHGRTKPWATATQWRPGRERLSGEQVALARKMRGRGDRLKDIAAAIGISITHAHRITEDAKCEKE